MYNEMMSLDLIIIVAAIVISFAVLGWLIMHKLNSLQSQNKVDDTLLTWLKTTQTNLQTNNQAINQSLQHNTQAINQRLDHAAKYMATLTEQIGQMSEIGRSMQDLQDFLKSPKLRGNLGEEVLNDMISQMFPKQAYTLQYSFKSGEKVDVALKTEAGILSIDSKFPMENFRKLVDAKDEKHRQAARKQLNNDVRKHIRDIAKKYILPDEGTLDFAIMYVPSEPIYYEVVNTADLIDYARDSRVYLVSPSTLYALLQTILISFEGKRIEGQSKKIMQLLRAIQTDYQKTEDHLGVLNKHLANAYTKMSEVNQTYGTLGQKLNQTNLLE